MGSDVWDPGEFPQLEPLLRELLRSGFVVADPETGGWRLAEVAQRRLSQLAAPPPPADKVVHFGHRCGACHELRPTRRMPEGYLCDACAAQQLGVSGTVPAVSAVR
jgi:hypothetical protein